MADARLGGTFLRFPASLAGAATLLVAARLPGLDALAGLASALGAQALSELAIRCLVSSRRLHMAGKVIWRGVRNPAVLGLALALAAVRVVPAPEVPRPTPEQVALRLMADPAVAAADAAVRDATHQSDGTVPASLRSSTAMLERVRAFQAFWAAERARSHSATDVSGRCATWPPSPPCAVQGAASAVPDSGGTLLYRIVRRGEAHGDGMFPSEMLDVLQAAGPDSWTPILRVAYDPGRASRVPRQVASPAGPMLILPPASPWSIQLGEIEGGTQVFLRQGTAWRRIDVASWLQQAAQSLPPHQCLLRATYGLSNVPLATDIEPDFRTLSVLGQYGPQAGNLDRAAGRAEFRFGIDDQTLVIRDVTLTSYPERRPWWRRSLQRGPEC